MIKIQSCFTIVYRIKINRGTSRCELSLDLTYLGNALKICKKLKKEEMEVYLRFLFEKFDMFGQLGRKLDSISFIFQ